MKLFNIQPTIQVVEFDKAIHMKYAKNILELDEILHDEMKKYRPKYAETKAEVIKNFTYQKYIDEALSNGWRIFLVILGQNCIGYFHIGSSSYADTAFIGGFIIYNKYRGKGYGKSAFDQLKDLLKLEFKHLILSVDEGNRYAKRLYEKQGFRPISQMMFVDI